MVTSYLEPVVTGAIGNPDELVLGDDGLLVTVGGDVLCDEPVTDKTGELVFGDDLTVVVVCGPNPDEPEEQFGILLENASMVTDMDCNWYTLLKIAQFSPIPYPLIGVDDPTLSDPRTMLPGSVTDESVSKEAGIAQSKLNLNGDIPPHYLLGTPTDPVTVTDDPATTVTGDDSATVTVGGLAVGHEAVVTGAVVNPLELVLGDDGETVIVFGSASGPTRLYAAPGNAVEYKSRKGVINGYVPLDASGKVPFAMYPSGAPVGTLNSFTLGPPSYMDTVPKTVTSGAATMVTTWLNVDGAQWLGSLFDMNSPVFSSSPLSPSMIPSLNTSTFTSGVFAPQQIPLAVGVGHPDHAPGAVPDPGATGARDDYLARDMTYKTMRPEPSYEPTIPDPSIVIVNFTDDQALITITDSLPGVSDFYRVNHVGTFQPVPGDTFYVDQGATVEAYCAKIGYQNSHVASLIIPTP